MRKLPRLEHVLMTSLVVVLVFHMYLMFGKPVWTSRPLEWSLEGYLVATCIFLQARNWRREKQRLQMLDNPSDPVQQETKP